MTTIEILRLEAGIVAILLTLWLIGFLGWEGFRALRGAVRKRRSRLFRRNSKRTNFLLSGHVRW